MHVSPRHANNLQDRAESKKKAREGVLVFARDGPIPEQIDNGERRCAATASGASRTDVVDWEQCDGQVSALEIRKGAQHDIIAVGS